jgi:uncharacterized membrane protein YbhN (UPF0104 family)
MFFVKTYKWFYICQVQNLQFTYRQLFFVNTKYNFYACFTPGKLGELGKFYFIYRYSANKSDYLLNAVLDRFFELYIVITFGIAAYLFEFSGTLPSIGIVGAALAVIFIFVLFKDHVYKFVLIFLPILVGKQNKNIDLTPTSSQLDIIAYRPVIIILLLTILSFGLVLVQIFTLSRAMGLEIPFLNLSIVYSIASVVNILPISIGGFGSREAVYSLFFPLFGYTIEDGFAISVLDTVIFTFVYFSVLYSGLMLSRKILKDDQFKYLYN